MAFKVSKGFSVDSRELPSDPDEEVIGFTPTVVFYPNDRKGDPFLLSRQTWNLLDKPKLIRVTVQAQPEYE